MKIGSINNVYGGLDLKDVGGTMDNALGLALLEDIGFGKSRDSHVDEITVDDFFDAIIEALDNDKDVFEYKKEVNADSWFGKQVRCKTQYSLILT